MTPRREAPSGSRLATLVTKLSAVNALAILAGLVTGPLQAQALGAAGRGALAAILVPATMAPWLLSFGLGGYSSRAVARGEPASEVLGTTALLSLGIGIMGAAAGIPLAFFLAGGREVVLVMLLIAFCTLPIALVQGLAGHIAVGLAEFRAVSISRLTPPLVALIAVPTLYVLGELTVSTSAAVAFAGGLLAALPLLPMVIRCGRPRFRLATARKALSFGARTWLGTLSGLANARVDQLVMIKAVPERELGLYAVAVTLASLSAIGTSALSSAILPRVAQGDVRLVARTLRVSLLLLLMVSLACAAVAPVALPVLFGAEFEEATVMVWILLVAGLFVGATSILGPALTSLGSPGASSIGKLIGLCVTAAGLPLLLPPLGGEGAALVTVAAYMLEVAYFVTILRRKAGGTVRSYLIVTRQDVSWLFDLVRRTRSNGRASGE